MQDENLGILNTKHLKIHIDMDLQPWSPSQCGCAFEADKSLKRINTMLQYVKHLPCSYKYIKSGGFSGSNENGQSWSAVISRAQ
jgi:hypothetical protein